MLEINQGYKIIASETYRVLSDDKEERIVLGKMETRLGTQYVTWESTRHPAEDEVDYFWGRYFDSEDHARADYHRRLADHYFSSEPV